VKLGVAATAAFGADVLRGLAARHEVVFLLSRPDRPRGRGRRMAPTPAKVAAQELGIPVLQPERLGPDVELDADVMVIAAYGLRIPDEQLAQRLWLNVHPSLLPRWRGAAPVERAIIAGDDETGVTIHETVSELDAGPIAAQEAFPIALDDDAGAVFSRAAELGVEVLGRVLPDPTFEPQPDEGATYAAKIEPADRELDWSRPPRELHDRIRALSPHIGARGELHGRRVLVWRSRLADDGSLEILEVQPEGKRRMGHEEWVRGLR
jgi:methionyl-tRNA formyltransferase